MQPGMLVSFKVFINQVNFRFGKRDFFVQKDAPNLARYCCYVDSLYRQAKSVHPHVVNIVSVSVTNKIEHCYSLMPNKRAGGRGNCKKFENLIIGRVLINGGGSENLKRIVYRTVYHYRHYYNTFISGLRKLLYISFSNSK